jgi:hypothetical protein
MQSSSPARISRRACAARAGPDPAGTGLAPLPGEWAGAASRPPSSPCVSLGQDGAARSRCAGGGRGVSPRRLEFELRKVGISMAEPSRRAAARRRRRAISVVGVVIRLSARRTSPPPSSDQPPPHRTSPPPNRIRGRFRGFPEGTSGRGSGPLAQGSAACPPGPRRSGSSADSQAPPSFRQAVAESTSLDPYRRGQPSEGWIPGCG